MIWTKSTVGAPSTDARTHTRTKYTNDETNTPTWIGSASAVKCRVYVLGTLPTKEFTILLRHTGTECTHSATLTANTCTTSLVLTYFLSYSPSLWYFTSRTRTFIEKETNRFESDSNSNSDVWNPSIRRTKLDQNRIGERQTHTQKSHVAVVERMQ